MDAILRRLPSQSTLHRHRGKIAGLACGVIGTLLAAGLISVSYTGYGIGVTPPPPPVIYPNF